MRWHCALIDESSCWSTMAPVSCMFEKWIEDDSVDYTFFANEIKRYGISSDTGDKEDIERVKQMIERK